MAPLNGLDLLEEFYCGDCCWKVLSYFLKRGLSDIDCDCELDGLRNGLEPLFAVLVKNGLTLGSVAGAAASAGFAPPKRLDAGLLSAGFESPKRLPPLLGA